MNIKITRDFQNPKLLLVNIDDDLWKKIHLSIVSYSKCLVLTRCHSLTHLETIFSELEYKGVQQFLLKRLSLRNYGSPELRKLLIDRFVPLETSDLLINEFIKKGYINDKDWEEGLIKNLKRKGFGPKMIALKLKSKGISSKILSSDCQEEEIKHLLETKYRSRDLNSFEEKRKTMMALYRRGFDFEAIHKALP